MKRDVRSAIEEGAEKLEEAVGAVADRIMAAMITSADTFVENAAIADEYEIEAAQLALRRARSSEVRALARMLLDAHITSAHQLGAALEMNETRGVAAPPISLDERHQHMIDHLISTPDDEFDSAFLDQQVLAHQHVSALLRGYQNKGDNAQLRSFAAAGAPAVGRHLAKLEALKDQLHH